MSHGNQEFKAISGPMAHSSAHGATRIKSIFSLLAKQFAPADFEKRSITTCFKDKFL